MSDLFTPERLTKDIRKEINLARDWLDRIERDAINERVCVQAGLLLDLGQSYAKLSYVVGMLNKSRLTEREAKPATKAS